MSWGPHSTASAGDMVFGSRPDPLHLELDEGGAVPLLKSRDPHHPHLAGGENRVHPEIS